VRPSHLPVQYRTVQKHPQVAVGLLAGQPSVFNVIFTAQAGFLCGCPGFVHMGLPVDKARDQTCNPHIHRANSIIPLRIFLP
jgi:hypothetical protein